MYVLNSLMHDGYKAPECKVIHLTTIGVMCISFTNDSGIEDGTGDNWGTLSVDLGIPSNLLEF